MPALPSVTGLIRLLLIYNLPNVPLIINRLFFQGTGSTTNAALNTYCSNVVGAWATNVSPQCVPDLALTSVTAEDLTSQTAPNGSASSTHVGTNAGTATMPGSAFIIRNQDNVRQRGGHSRTYLPGLPTTFQGAAGGSTWSPASASAVLTAWQNFITAISGSNAPTGYSAYNQVVPNYYKGFTVVTSPITHRARNVPTPLTTPNIYVITVHNYNPQIGSQRRRNKQTS